MARAAMVSTSLSTVCTPESPEFGPLGVELTPSGSAPDISGKGIVNPIGTILSCGLMLLYSLNLPAEAHAIEEAVRRTIDAGIRTKDIGGTNTTTEVGDAVAKELEKVLKESS